MSYVVGAVRLFAVVDHTHRLRTPCKVIYGPECIVQSQTCSRVAVGSKEEVKWRRGRERKKER